jgi:hypothetical protein
VARDTGVVERSFEFLHATFGEFLAARQIVVALVDLADERLHQRRRPQAALDAGFLYAGTSFATITRRAPLFDFCRGMLARLTADQRQRCRDLVIELLPEAGYPHPTWSLADYRPRRKPVAARHAAFTANLVCFAVLLSDRPVDVVELVGEPVVLNWRAQALLWQSQLDSEDRQRTWQTLRVAWRLDVCPTRLEVRVEDGADVGLYESVPWPPDDRPLTHSGDRLRETDLLVLSGDAVVPAESTIGRSIRRSAFVQTAHEVREHLYSLAVYWRTIGDVAPVFRESLRLSDADVLLRLLLTPADQQPVRQHLLLFRFALEAGSSPFYRHLVLRQLAEDAARLSVEDVLTLMSYLRPGDVVDNPEQMARLVAVAATRGRGDSRPVNLLVGLLIRGGADPATFEDPLVRAFAGVGLPIPDWAKQALGDGG